ncbi:MAG: hypothetical protein GY797_03190 [Deltaproteobacteria bacterium]|nr:hypothetical protein [Deltaproteobacteria bacterium]
MDLGKTWFFVVFSIIFTRAAFVMAKGQPMNRGGLLMGGYFGAIGGTAIGAIIGALISRIIANVITLVNPEVNFDIYQITVYGGISGAIIGTVGGTAVGAIGGSWPGDIEKIPRSVFIWLQNIAISLAFLVMGIGFTIVLGKPGGLAMYGSLSASMQWYVLGGELNRYDIKTSVNFTVGFVIWTIVAIFTQSLGSIAVGAIGATIVGIGQWFVFGKRMNSSMVWWVIGCATLGAILGSIVKLFTEYVIL